MTIDFLNKTHAEWMALDPNATPEEKQRVFRLMDKRPNGYLSGSFENGFGIILNGQPLTANKMPLNVALDRARELGVQTKFAWSAPGWIELLPAMASFIDQLNTKREELA